MPALSYLNSLRLRGYRYHALKGARSTWSELLIHCQQCGKPARFALINQNNTYAYVVFQDGTMCDGTWIQHADGRFALG